MTVDRATTDWPRLVSDVLIEARRRAGNGSLLAEELHRLGVGPEGRYSESAVSNWVKGRAMPPADVLLAAATIGGISLDSKLGDPTADLSEASAPAVDQLTEEVRRLSRLMAQMQGQLMHLYGRMGEAYPHDEADPQTGAASKAVG